MRNSRSILIGLALALLGVACGDAASSSVGERSTNPPPATCGEGAVTSACLCGAATVSSGSCCGGVAQATACSAALIVDHRAATAAAFAGIPDEWLAKAKALTVHYAHTSHGGQLVTGLHVLEGRDPARYPFAIRENQSTEGLPAPETPPALRIYDGNAPDTYITPELYWDGDAGIARTKAVVGTGRYDVSMWAWCGQQSTNSVATVQRYLAQMAAFQRDYPDVRFVLFTGHTDGTGVNGTLDRNNQLVRDFALANGMALYDFADIESWMPDGTDQRAAATDACPWCSTWCADSAHAAECASLPASGTDHTHGFNILLKGRATWWMMARLAGWDGT